VCDFAGVIIPKASIMLLGVGITFGQRRRIGLRLLHSSATNF
jgi:hypothetical protein